MLCTEKERRKASSLRVTHTLVVRSAVLPTWEKDVTKNPCPLWSTLGSCGQPLAQGWPCLGNTGKHQDPGDFNSNNSTSLINHFSHPVFCSTIWKMGTVMLLRYLSAMRTITGELCLRARWYYMYVHYIYVQYICMVLYICDVLQNTSQWSAVLDGILVVLYVLLSISSIYMAGKKAFEFINLLVFM